jgi:hypothetical protein
MTEGKPFDDLGAAKIEIRAFDTTYFEIYTNNRELIDPIAIYFGVEIQKQYNFP